MWYLVLLIIMLLFLNNNKESYINYTFLEGKEEEDVEDTTMKYPIVDPYQDPNQIGLTFHFYSENFQTINKLQKVEKPLELYAYTPNQYLDEMRFVKTEGPIPVDPDFFI